MVNTPGKIGRRFLILVARRKPGQRSFGPFDFIAGFNQNRRAGGQDNLGPRAKTDQADALADCQFLTGMYATDDSSRKDSGD